MTEQSEGIECWRAEPGHKLGGEIRVPGDKSISHRAVMLGAIADGPTRIRGFLESADCIATLRALAQMGTVHRTEADGTLVVEGLGHAGLRDPEGTLDLGNSGTGMRLLMGLLAGQGVDAELTGDASLCRRPMERIAKPLRMMGAAVTTSDGTPPVRVNAHRGLKGIRYVLPVASAQIKSAVLLAGLGASGRTEVASPAASRDHTERMLQTMGVALTVSDDGLEAGFDGPVRLKGTVVDVPGDLSSAAFFIAGAAFGAREPLLIRDVGVNPTRDGILRILALMGARIERSNERLLGAEPVADLRIHPGELRGIEVPEALVPLAIDELPMLFVAAAAARGRTVVTGAGELRVKESDRLRIVAEALTAVGVDVEETADGMIVHGGRIGGGTVETAGDHRIAMAFAVASAASLEPIVIRDTRPVGTSFPNFVAVARAAGLEISPAAA